MSSLVTRKPIDGRNGQRRWATSAQDKRVRNALKRQRTRRRDLSHHARQIATGSFECTTITTNAPLGTTTGITTDTTFGSNHALEMNNTQQFQQNHCQQQHFTNATTTTTTSTTTTKKRKQRKNTLQNKRSSNQESPKVHRHYANQLSHHDWMISVPSDLSYQNANLGSTDQVGWYVSPRPEGQRC